MKDFYLPNDVLLLTDLSEVLHLNSDKFIVKEKFDGGMGTCYRIEDINKKSYALKVIHKELLLDDESMHRYYEELRLWMTFSSCEGVSEALHITKINDIPCVASTWMECGDMNSLIDILDKDCFYHCMDRIISTLKWVYDNYNVIHRDLKPGNILIDREKKAYVADWGLAKIITKPDNNYHTNNKELGGINPYLTQSGTFLGTVLYSSPEQLMGLPNIDHRSDIYSIGCIMYQWETGQPPFLGNTLQEIAAKHLYTKPKKLGGLFKTTNFRSENIIMKCLEKNPNNRYQTYEELLKDLHKVAVKQINKYQPYVVKERYLPVNIGYKEFENRLNDNNIGIVSDKGFGLVSQEDITPYLKEAILLGSLGEHKKSASIYERLFIKELFESFPDFGLHQMVAINLANEYCHIKELDKALNTILTISHAQQKPATYYVNLSNIYLNMSDCEKSILTCEEGLQIYPEDKDLLGNYTIGLSKIGRIEEAVYSAKKRLSLVRDTHALCECAYVFLNIAESLKNKDFPKAIDFYKKSLALYREALSINPTYKDALYNVSLLLFKLKRLSDAIDFGIEISKIEKGTSELNAFYAARNMLWMWNFQEGLDFCNDWLKKYPNSILLKRIKSEIIVDGFVIDHYTKDGLPIVERSSLEFFTEIVKNPILRVATDVIFLAKLHCWMGTKNDIEYGIQLFEWGKKQYPDNWKFNFYLAGYALKFQNPKRALNEALECARKAPWRETSYSMLANAYSANGDEAMADTMKIKYESIKKKKRILYDSCKSL